MAKVKKTSRNLSTVLLVALIIVSIATVPVHMFLINQQNAALKQAAEKKQSIKLPANAVKLSGCVPYMGEHWVDPANLPNGPMYFVHNGEVIGFEYMFTPDQVPNEELAKASTPQEAIAYMQRNNLTFADTVYPHLTVPLDGYNVKFMSLEWTPPHAGVVAPHYDLHYYFIDKSEVNDICPDSKIENVDTPEIRQRLDELNIPYPGSQQ
jgi:hypothetical protein